MAQDHQAPSPALRLSKVKARLSHHWKITLRHLWQDSFFYPDCTDLLAFFWLAHAYQQLLYQQEEQDLASNQREARLASDQSCDQAAILEKNGKRQHDNIVVNQAMLRSKFNLPTGSYTR